MKKVMFMLLCGFIGVGCAVDSDPTEAEFDKTCQERLASGEQPFDLFKDLVDCCPDVKWIQRFIDITRGVFNINAEYQLSDGDQVSPLRYAAQKTRFDIVLLLLGREDLDLSLADRRFDIKQIKKVIATMSNINERYKFSDDYVVSPLSYAVGKNRLDIVELLLEREDLDLSLADSVALFKILADRRFDIKWIKKVIAIMPDINKWYKPSNGYATNPLFCAVLKNRPDIVKFLLGCEGLDLSVQHPLFRTTALETAQTQQSFCRSTDNEKKFIKAEGGSFEEVIHILSEAGNSKKMRLM